MSGKNRPKLSKGILEMKFMKRTKEKVDKEADDAEGRAMYSTELTEKMMTSNSNFIIEPSFVFCENLIEGRLSFHGMNPEIERILELEQAAKNEKINGQIGKEVDDKEMQDFYRKNSTVSKTISRKFETKRKFRESSHQAPKNKFMKPNDD